ncbi:MAG TPA: hypothetical protein VFI37_05525 [Gaiellaceae bacterium]|jgi:hypothetical protein|nr:hypothetical protein [Gaiellaceae bacterium]
MRSTVASAAAVAVAICATAAGGSAQARENVCRPASMHYAPYPGGAPGLGRLPWVRADSQGLGLVALLWYWPDGWRARRVAGARIFTRGRAPDGRSTKILWAFLSPKAERAYRGGNLIVRGRRLDGPGTTWQQFVGIGYAGQKGAPSFASIVRLPTAGCWRLRLGAGGLHASVVLSAVAG